MGYIISTAASRTIEAVVKQYGKNPYSNTYRIGEKEWFFEQSRKTLPDYGASGTVNLMVGDNLALKKGSFRVAENGTILRWPGLPSKWVKEYNQRIVGGSYS